MLFNPHQFQAKTFQSMKNLPKFNEFILVVNGLEMQKMQTVRRCDFWQSDLRLVLAKQLVSNYSSNKKTLGTSIGHNNIDIGTSIKDQNFG